MTDVLGGRNWPARRDWDDAFANMAHIPVSEALPALWTARAAAYRAEAQAAGRRLDLDIAYGDAPRERFDLVWPDGPPRGLCVFIHGGYWMATDKSFWTDLAEGARLRGWVVCLPGYTLTPEIRISGITAQIGRAITAAAALVDGPIRLSGHSAGGHLAARMICADSPLPAPVFDRIEATVPISGLFDLRPLLHTRMNASLGLDLAEATAESPALQMPRGLPRLSLWVGGGERPEFLRQSRLMAQIWEGLDARVACTVDGEHDHFTVLNALKDPASPLVEALVGP
jgi:acetyl esterase/lipase